MHIGAPAAHTVIKYQMIYLFSEITARLDASDDLLDVLKTQLQEFRELLDAGSDGGLHVRCSRFKADVKGLNDALTVFLCRDVGPSIQDLTHAERRLHRLSR